jgi:hypothetical protein
LTPLGISRCARSNNARDFSPAITITARNFSMVLRRNFLP